MIEEGMPVLNMSYASEKAARDILFFKKIDPYVEVCQDTEGVISRMYHLSHISYWRYVRQVAGRLIFLSQTYLHECVHIIFRYDEGRDL